MKYVFLYCAPWIPFLSSGTPPVFRQLLNTAQLVAATRATVLIGGESGSGKENLARFLHSRSPLSSRPFIAVNCANLPENLVESELFGHRRGAFSNAIADRDGLESMGSDSIDNLSSLTPLIIGWRAVPAPEHPRATPSKPGLLDRAGTSPAITV